jgi:hypothetical protein
MSVPARSPLTRMPSLMPPFRVGRKLSGNRGPALTDLAVTVYQTLNLTALTAVGRIVAGPDFPASLADSRPFELRVPICGQP